MSIKTLYNLGDKVRRKPDDLGYEWMVGTIDKIEAKLESPPYAKHEINYHIKCDDEKKSQGFHCWEPEDKIEKVV